MTFIGWILISIGLFIILSGIVGLFRFPDFYTKLHAAGVIDACGVPMCLVGLACLQELGANSFKLIFAALLILLLNPTATQALAKASLIKKKRKVSNRITQNKTNDPIFEKKNVS